MLNNNNKNHIKELIAQHAFVRTLSPQGEPFAVCLGVFRVMLEERFGIPEEESDQRARDLVRQRYI